MKLKLRKRPRRAKGRRKRKIRIQRLLRQSLIFLGVFAIMGIIYFFTLVICYNQGFVYYKPEGKAAFILFTGIFFSVTFLVHYLLKRKLGFMPFIEKTSFTPFFLFFAPIFLSTIVFALIRFNVVSV